MSLLAIGALGAIACSPETPQTKPPASTTPASSASPAGSPAAIPSGSPATNANAGKVDSLVGKWTGADNASLTVTKKGDKFSIDIAGKEGIKSFEGTAKGDAIEFTRNNKVETIKTATGTETGVNALEKETNCVVVTKGTEAFCRK